jgi:nicotinamide mononucleotide transporter
MDVTQALILNNLCQWLGKNWQEVFAVVTGLLYIYLEIKQKPSMWVVGFISSFVYVFVYFQSKVYGSATLYAYYVIVSVYGWYCWRYARQSDGSVTDLQVNRLQISLAIVLASITAVLFAGIGYTLDRFTDSPVPYLDALGVSFGIVATWMLARKILEHWILWIFINFYSSALYFYLELYPTAGLFVVYGVLSVVGWLKWRQTMPRGEVSAS